jgi:endonuclease G
LGTHKFIPKLGLLFVLWLFFLFLGSALAIDWPAWDNNTPEPHIVFGVPTYVGHDPNHDTVRDYEAFTVYYDDTVLSPRWTAIKLTRSMVDKNSQMKRLKRFKTDTVLKDKGYQVTTHDDYSNPKGVRKWDRGHMVSFDDARGYGQTAGEDSFYTTNICPQLSLLNEEGWLTLEKTCDEFARDYNVIWIYAGPIYGEQKVPFAEGRKIPKPIAFFKIVVTPGDNNEVRVLAFRIPHESLPANVDLSKYLVSVKDMKNETGLDFFYELPHDVENAVESTVGPMWPDLPNEKVTE